MYVNESAVYAIGYICCILPIKSERNSGAHRPAHAHIYCAHSRTCSPDSSNNTDRSERQIRQERTHPRNNESDAGFQKMTDRRLNWYGDVMRRGEKHILRKEEGTTT